MKKNRDQDVSSLTINDAIYERGLFIQRYAGIEFALSHLLVAASLTDEYREIGSMPFNLSKKLKNFEKLLETRGPISRYKTRLNKHLTFLQGIDDVRQFVVHGIMVTDEIAGECICIFRLYSKVGDEVIARAHDMTIDEFRQLTSSIQPHSSSFTAMVARIVRKLDLKPIDDLDIS